MALFSRRCAAAVIPTALTLAALGAARPAAAQAVFVVSSDGEFGTVSLQTGAFTLVDDNYFPVQMAALGFAPDGTLYGLATGGDGTDLYSIDPTNGDLLSEKNVSGNSINGGSIVGDTFYALSADPSATLFTVNTTTDTSTDIQTGTGVEADGLTVLDGRGNVYAADTSVSPGTNGDDGIDVIKQNGGSAAPTVLGTGDTGLNYLYSGVFTNNTLYGFGDDSTGALGVFTINTTTGASTLVAPVTGLAGNILFAAALTPAPEPSQSVGLGFGALGLGGLVLRARKNRWHA